MFSYFFSFAPRAIADTFKLLEYDLDISQALQVVITIADRVKYTVIYIFVFAISEIRIKLESQSH